MADAQTPPAWSQGLKKAALSATAAASFFTSFGAMPANAPNAPQDNWQQQPVTTDVQSNVEKSATPVLDEKLKNLSGKPPSAEESVLGAYRAPDGKVTIKNIAGDPDQNHDYASVGKMVSIGYMDDLVQDKTINLKDKILPQYAKEFNLPPHTTYSDVMKATYYYSNNDTAQAMFKSAMHEKHNFHDSVHVSNTQVAEELSGYMKENGFTHSFQSNAAGYPEWSDEASKAYSAPRIPSRSTGYRPGELANFMVNKYCEGTGHTISDETANLLDLDVKQAPFSVPITNKGVPEPKLPLAAFKKPLAPNMVIQKSPAALPRPVTAIMPKAVASPLTIRIIPAALFWVVVKLKIVKRACQSCLMILLNRPQRPNRPPVVGRV